jgi:hypothetical protein
MLSSLTPALVAYTVVSKLSQTSVVGKLRKAKLDKTVHMMKDFTPRSIQYHAADDFQPLCSGTNLFFSFATRKRALAEMALALLVATIVET